MAAKAEEKLVGRITHYYSKITSPTYKSLTISELEETAGLKFDIDTGILTLPDGSSITVGPAAGGLDLSEPAEPFRPEPFLPGLEELEAKLPIEVMK